MNRGGSSMDSHSRTREQASVFEICSFCKGRTTDPRDVGPRFQVLANILHLFVGAPWGALGGGPAQPLQDIGAQYAKEEGKHTPSEWFFAT
jgi:hypothetical protein